MTRRLIAAGMAGAGGTFVVRTACTCDATVWPPPECHADHHLCAHCRSTPSGRYAPTGEHPGYCVDCADTHARTVRRESRISGSCECGTCPECVGERGRS